MTKIFLQTNLDQDSVKNRDPIIDSKIMLIIIGVILMCLGGFGLLALVGFIMIIVGARGEANTDDPNK